MMMLTKTLIMAILLGTLCSCATMRITSDYDPDANFSDFKTFSWISGEQKETGDPRIDNAILDGRIRKAVENQLMTQGYSKVSPDNADFLVAYHAAIEKRMSVQVMNDYYGYGSGWGYTYGSAYAPMGSSTYVHEYEEGALILDLVEPKSKKLRWRGSAQAEVNRADSIEKRDKRLGKAVRRILERFPPK